MGRYASCVLITGATFSALQYLLLELMEGPLNSGFMSGYRSIHLLLMANQYIATCGQKENTELQPIQKKKSWLNWMIPRECCLLNGS